MARIKFTDTAIGKLPPAQSGTDWYLDTDLQGFQLAVGKQKRSFYLVKSLNNRQRRIKLGEWPSVPARAARRNAQAKIGEISQGRLPGVEKQDDLTVEQALDRYIEKRTARTAKKTIGERTAQDYRDILRLHLPARWLNRPIAEISEDEIKRLHESDRLFEIQSTADKLVRVFRAIRKDCGIAPGIDFEFYSSGRKENAIKPLHRRTIGSAILSIENPVRRAAWLFGTYTGIRKSNILALIWDHIDFERQTVFVEKMKNRHARYLHLSSQALAALDLVRDLDERWLFPSLAGSESGALVEVRDTALPPDVGFHDTRRVFTECAAECLLPEYVIGYLRGDVVNSSMTQRYISHLEVPEAAQRIGDRIEEQLFTPMPLKVAA